jgi:probable F420-dependent oxidoreductase
MAIRGAAHVGVTSASIPSLGVGGFLDVARTAGALGCGSFWVAETVGTEAFATLAAAGAAQPGMGLGTGVLALQLRTPMVTAMGAATLQALHPEADILLGVGISSPVVVGKWHGTAYPSHPLAQTREYLELLNLCLSGESVTYEGEYYRCSRFKLGVRLGDKRPKVILGALGPKMLALGGELADGVLLNYLPAASVPWSVEQVRRGGDAAIYAYVHVGVCEREDAMEPARRDLFSYAVVDAYAAGFERAGFGAEVAAIRERHAAGDREGAVAVVSDAMVDAIDIVGDEAHVEAAVQSYVDAGVEVPVVMPLPWGPDRRAVVDATLRAVMH